MNESISISDEENIDNKQETKQVAEEKENPGTSRSFGLVRRNR